MKGLNADESLDPLDEEDTTCEEEGESEEQQQNSALDMLASNNSEEFTPEMVAITKAQNGLDIAEDASIGQVTNRAFTQYRGRIIVGASGRSFGC